MGNIKFFPQGLDLFTLTSVTDSATGHAKELMLDRRKATYWEALNTSGNKDINIDLGQAAADGYIPVDYVALYYNCSDIHMLQVYSDVVADYSGMTQRYSQSGSSGWQLKIITFNSVTDERYWKIRFNSLGSGAPQVAFVFISTSYEITCRYAPNDIDGEIDYSGVKLIDTRGGNRGAVENAPPRKYWKFSYEMLDITNKAKLDSILALSNGPKYPIIFQDIAGNYYYVRIILPMLGAQQVIHQAYNINDILIQEELGSPI